MVYEYSKNFDISYSRSDRWLGLGLVDAGYMSQEMVTDFYKSFGCDNLSTFRRDNAVWVITKSRIHFIENPKWGDLLTARTVNVKSHGFKTEAETVFRKDGQMCFVSRQEMCIMDATARDVRRIDSIYYPQDMETEAESLPIKFFRLRETFSESDLSYSDRFRLCDIDFSNHVNNVVYIRYLVNALNSDFFENIRVVDCEVQYRHECHEGHELSVYKKDIDQNTMDFQIVSDGNVAIEARIVYEKKN